MSATKERMKWLNAGLEVDRLRGGFTMEEVRVLYDDLRTLPWQPERGYDARRSLLKKLEALLQMHDMVAAYFAKAKSNGIPHKP